MNVALTLLAGLTLAAAPAKLTLLYTADNLGELAPCG